jgi:hypothetical protein
MQDILDQCTDDDMCSFYSRSKADISDSNYTVSSVTNSENKEPEEEILGNGRVKRSRLGED